MTDSMANVSIEFLRRQLESEHKKGSKTLKSGDGGGISDGMEARVAKLEASSEFIQREITDLKSEIRGMRNDARSDFRLMFGAIIAVALGLAGIMAKGFGWI